MEPARPLRDVFADLVTDEDARRAHAADPDGFLQAHGHTGLSGQLVNEAIVNYADTAPTEVAEHLAPFVMAHSPVPVDDPAAGADGADGLHLLATAPAEAYLDELPDDGLDDDLGGGLAGGLDGDLAAGPGHPVDPAAVAADPFDLDFGQGDQAEDMQPVPPPDGAPAGADDLVPGAPGAHGWLATDHGAIDSGNRVTDLEQDLDAHRDVLDAGHNLADLEHDLDAHRAALDTRHDLPDEDIADS
jgi:hypothetical protein